MRNFLMDGMESAGTRFLYVCHCYIRCMMPCIVAVVAELGSC